MKLSIITVCLNSEKSIERTIKSVINQKTQDVEYIVVDGKSIDNTVNIIQKYEKYIDYFVSEKDSGIYDAMNKGIKKATGDVVAFLNSDDYYEENILGKIIEKFTTTELDVVYGKIRVVYDNGYTRTIKPLSEHNLCIFMCMCHQAVFAKRELFLQYGLFRLDYKIAADYDALLKWYYFGAKFMYIDEIIATYGLEGISNVEEEKSYEEMYRIAVSYLDTSEKKEKYSLAIEENKKLSDKNIQRKNFLLENNSLMVENLKKFIDSNKKVFIFGCGYGSVRCYRLFIENKMLFHGYIDNDIKKQGMNLKEYYTYSPDILKNKKEKVIVSSVKYSQEISYQLEKMGYVYKEDYIFFDDLLEKDISLEYL